MNEGPWRLRVVLIGPPAAGKSTQAARLAQHFRVRCISAREVFSEHDASLLGRSELQKLMVEGRLFPDYLANDIILERVQTYIEDGFVLEGFPRTVTQGLALEERLAKHGVTLDAVVELRVCADTIRKRIAGRAGESGFAGLKRRPDDNLKSVQARLEAFNESTGPLLRHYDDRGLLICFDGEGSIDATTAGIIKCVA